MKDKLKRKFIKDTNLPIQVLDSPYFEYFLDLYEPTYKSRSSWEKLRKEIKDGSIEDWMKMESEVIEKIIKDITTSDPYQTFIKDKNWDSGISEIGNTLYSESNLGKKFLGIDISKANFQALRYYNPSIFLNEDTWENFVGLYTESEHIKSSKNIRQVIFGKTNPSRIIRVEKYLCKRIEEIISLPNLFSRKTDEVIWEVPKDFSMTEDNYSEIIKNKLGIDVSVNVFSLDIIKRFTHSGSTVTGFIKNYDYPSGKEPELKDVPKMYFAQFYKILNDIEPNLIYDLVTCVDGQLARFDYPLLPY